MDSRLYFYEQAVRRFIPNTDASILVVAGHKDDRDVLYKLGFTNVVVSNLDTRVTDTAFHPYRWSFQDARQLTYKDDEFDFVIINAALHHCSSPHRALLEMYRVARVGLLAIEGRDSLVMQLLKIFNFTQNYEWVGVFYYEGGEHGGVDNTQIPNYVYRWTENEVEKTINSFAPYAKNQFHYRYGSSLPLTPSLVKGAYLKRFMVYFFLPIYKLFVLLFPRQQNLFAFFVSKPTLPDDLHPWLKLCKGKIQFNKQWAEKIVGRKPLDVDTQNML